MPKIFTLDSFGGPVRMSDASIASGMAFLNGELEKRDPRLNEPLQSVTWPRDIVARTGGGYPEFTSHYFVNYATTGGEGGGVIGGESNDIPIIQADVAKSLWKVFPFANIIKVPFLDQQRMQGIGRSLDDLYDEGLRLNYNKSIDNLVYVGWPSQGVTGLVNATNVTAGMVAATGTGGTTEWVNKTPPEILADINTVIQSVWDAAQFDVTGIPNHILLPPTQFGYIATELVSTAGSQSILEYVLKNNLARTQGVDISIVPSRWTTGAGTGASDRMVAYVNAENRVNIDITQPLGRIMTQPQVTEMAYLTAYAAAMSQVKILYPQTMQYADGI